MLLRLEVSWVVRDCQLGWGYARCACDGQIRDNVRIYVPSQVKGIPGFSVFLSLEVCLASLLHKLKVCCNTLCWSVWRSRWSLNGGVLCSSG